MDRLKTKSQPQTKTQRRRACEQARRFPALYFSKDAPMPTYEELSALTNSADEMRSKARKRYGLPIAQRYQQAYQSPDRSVHVRMFFISLQQVLEYREHDHPVDWAEFASAVESFCGITGANAEIDKILHALRDNPIGFYQRKYLRGDIKTMRSIIPCPTNTNTPSPELCELFGYLFTAEVEDLMAYPLRYRKPKFRM